MTQQQLCDLYHLVKAEVDKVDFQSLWDRFEPLRFALYDQEQCCFDGVMIEKTNDFLANTAINYHGEWSAIWNVSDEINPKILASKMVHEMFHSFQYANQESRFPDELQALYTYHYSDENLSVKLEENRLLVELSQEFSPAKLKKVLSLRKFRAEHFPNEFLYEAQVEQIEGSANYVELNALKQLCLEAYEKKLCKIQKSITAPKLFQNISSCTATKTTRPSSRTTLSSKPTKKGSLLRYTD